MTRVVIAMMWLAHWLPLPLLAALGRGLGWALYWLAAERRHVTLRNLELCFPELPPGQRTTLAKEHLMLFGRSFLELGLWWWASPVRIRRLVKLENTERLAAFADKPVILLVPHFVGIDAGAIRLMLEHSVVAIYTHQKNRLFEEIMNNGRRRFGNCELVSRQEGPRKALRAMKSGRYFHYSPDMDFGPKEAIFVPFFGVQAATVTSLPRLAKLTGAAVIPLVTRMEGSRYIAAVGEPWADFPSGDEAADVRRMNVFIEAEVRQSPAQYYWLHKRFKTRPVGEAKLY